MQNDIFTRIENSKKVDFGDVISKSFELYKQYFSQGLTHTLIVLLCIIPLILIVYVPLIPIYVEIIQNPGAPYYQPSFTEDYSIGVIAIWCVLVFATSFLVQFISMSVYGRFYKFLRKEDFDTNEDVGGYFTILKTHSSKLLLISLASAGIVFVATLACYFPIFYVIVPLHWIFPIFIFNEELSVSDIVKAAFKFTNKNWLLFAGLGIVCSIMASLGAIACYIGLIATMFFTLIATYVTYRDSIGFNEETQKPKQIEA